MTRYTLVCNTQNGRWTVRDILRDKVSAEYDHVEALDLALWLEGREKRYELTDQKIRSILWA
jgi:hypothetical protein